MLLPALCLRQVSLAYLQGLYIKADALLQHQQQLLLSLVAPAERYMLHVTRNDAMQVHSPRSIFSLEHDHCAECGCYCAHDSWQIFCTRVTGAQNLQ